jgi:lipopolysaccharide/colanic/teichoic acid biosynthesis glycosyltransferase
MAQRGSAAQELVYQDQEYEPVRDPLHYLIIKRSLDLLLSIIALIALSPLLLITAIAIIIDDPHGGFVFTQTRIGYMGKAFRFYKFRSMCKDAESKLSSLQSQNEMDGPVFKIKNDPRITRVGRFIRKYSIDELPQLINIIKGDMSIVGPRPPLPNEVEKYTIYERRRLAVKPGLTCFWQVSGRNRIGFDDWMRLDMKYVDEHNLFLDAQLVAQTFGVVFSAKGAA